MTAMAYGASVNMSLKVVFGLASFGLLLALQPAPAAGQSLPGASVKSVISGTITVPAGRRVVVASVQTLVPSDLTHGSYLTTAFIYASAASNPTTCTLDLSGGAVKTPAITLPSNTTVFIPFEDAGDYNKGSSVSPPLIVNEVGVTAGSAGAVIVHEHSGIKTIVVSTTTASQY